MYRRSEGEQMEIGGREKRDERGRDIVGGRREILELETNTVSSSNSNMYLHDIVPLPHAFDQHRRILTWHHHKRTWQVVDSDPNMELALYQSSKLQVSNSHDIQPIPSPTLCNQNQPASHAQHNQHAKQCQRPSTLHHLSIRHDNQKQPISSDYSGTPEPHHH